MDGMGGMTLNGIDVSHWQATTPPLAGLSFLFAKASDGAGGPDPRYAQHIANARSAGLLVGAYHFAVKGDGAAQARAFLTAAGKVDFYALDREGNDPMTLAQAAAFINTVQAAGHKCGLYASESGYPNVGQDWNWVANWSRVPAIPWTFHQYRGSPLDLDHFNGDMAALRALAGIHPAPPPPPPPAPLPPGDDMVIPQTLGHVVTVRQAHLYSGPHLNAQLPSTLPAGTKVRKFGGVPGWQFIQHDYGKQQQYLWLKSDDVKADPQPLTVVEG